MPEVLDAPATVPVIQTAIAEYSPVASALADLAHRYRDVVFDVTTTKGNAEARAARLELVKLRTGLEAKRKEIKAPALERSRLIDAEAMKIASAIAELEVPIDDQIKADEQRREAEKQAKIDAEARRVTEIRERISMIAAVARRAIGQPSASVEDKIRLVVAIELGDAFAEFVEEARQVHAATLASLRETLTATVAHEAEAARVAAERIELDRLRAEDAERKRQEQERADAERKAEDARLAAARRELEAEQRAQYDELARLNEEATQRRRAADDKAAAERAEADRVAFQARVIEARRLDDERLEVQRQQAELLAAERAQRAEDERQAREAREAEILARSRLHDAAPLMLDALLLWRTVDQSRLSRNTDAWKQAGAAREAAIAAATTSPTA